MAVEDGLVTDKAGYDALDERDLNDWRMYRHALNAKTTNDAKRVTQTRPRR